jgi:hypothetical protein
MANALLHGFLNLQNVLGSRLTDVGTEVVYDAIQQSVAEHNRQIAALTSLFVMPTTGYKVRYRTPTAARLQPLDENGRARPIKPAGQYDVAFPIQMGGTAWGANYVTRQKMTVQEVNDATTTVLSADARWMRDHILAALFYDDNAGGNGWTWADEQYGNLNIMGLADADTVTYMVQTGADSGVTDDHYLAQAGAIANDANPYPTIYDELTEHPENLGEVICLIPTNLKATTEALTLFTPVSDPNVQVGLATDRLVGTLGAAVPGEVIGYVEKCWIVEWKSLPSGYIVSVTSDGQPALGMREHPEANLQGFQMVAERNDHPFSETQWLRAAGFGAWNRVGAVVYRVGNGTYAAPTGYSSPLA